MHEAMARLFDDDNTALADSAEAAGYLGPIPDRVVLIGHSLGGGAVAGIAGAWPTTTPRTGSPASSCSTVCRSTPRLSSRSRTSIPSIPDLPTRGTGYFWNQFGVGTDALLQARPDEFIGVTLVEGSHVDSMRGGNPLIQFAQELVAGFPAGERGGAEILMVGWANDMFAENQGDQRVGVYLDAGRIHDRHSRGSGHPG